MIQWLYEFILSDFGSILIFLLGLYFIRLYIEDTLLDDLKNKPVFVTGCDEGFAHHAALKLSSIGMPVFAGCYTKKGMDTLLEKSKGFPGPLTPISLDVTKDESVEAAGQQVEKLCEQYGGALHGIISSAGVGTNIFLDDFLKTDDYRYSMEVNLYGTIRVTKRFRKLVKKAQGRIAIVTSIMGRVAGTNIGPYTVSKHATNGFASMLRKEIAPFNVQVITIEPGFFKTTLTSRERVEKEIKAVWDRAPQDVRDEYGEEFLEPVTKYQADFIHGSGSSDITPAVDVYVKAMTSAYPRRKYKVGWDCVFLWHPIAVMPAWAQDFILGFLASANGAPVPKAVKELQARDRAAQSQSTSTAMSQSTATTVQQ